jgi:hypothetical protein
MKVVSRRLSGIVVIVLAGVSAASCADSEVTLVAPRRPSHPEGCPVQLFPTTHRSYSSADLASVRASCENFVGRSACVDQLRMQACAVGGDTVYGFSEGLEAGGWMFISATVAVRGEAPPTNSGAGIAAPVDGAVDPGCAPICSPGFACKARQCVPECNPACQPSEICNRHRTCEPAAAVPNPVK